MASDFLIAKDLGFVTEEEIETVLNAAYDLGIRINNLQKSQLRRVNDNR